MAAAILFKSFRADVCALLSEMAQALANYAASKVTGVKTERPRVLYFLPL